MLISHIVILKPLVTLTVRILGYQYVFPRAVVHVHVWKHTCALC